MEAEMARKKTENNPVEIPLETALENKPEIESPPQAVEEKIIEEDLIQVKQGNIPQVNAEKVEIQSGAANRVYAEQVTVHQGGVGMVQATSVSVNQGGIGFVRAGEANLENSSTQAVVTQTATVNGGTVGLLIAREVHANPLRAFVVLAQKIDGQVETTLDTRGAILAGLVAGIAAGLVSLMGRLLSQRKR
jgi:hypothetical protein